MNLHAVASRVVGVVNPPRYGTVRISTGSTVAPGGHRTPAYRIVRNVQMQIQELSERDLRQVNGLNVAGSTHTIYLFGRLDGLVRPDNKGGDLIEFDGRVWLVTALLEDWPDWCRVSVTLQLDRSS